MRERPSDHKHWTTTDVESYLRERDQRHADRLRRQAIDRYGTCPICQAPRRPDVRFGRYLGLECSENPGHPQKP